MRPISNYTIPGEAEYILLKSGLVAVRGSAVEPTQDLIALFWGAPVPPMAELEPVLIQVAEVTAYGLGGAMNVSKLRSQAMEAVRLLGITHTHGALSELFMRVRAGAEAAAEDIRNQPPIGAL
ncbi:hypothetical protein [Tautonia plasticadhaerens]|uniref:Uncharacterized protein n=1 Tax=Tautonia plasticadhaerens TaxID=2527974 RepID=A0A518H221_9BACT|nr:hypothetical protein [Tautonia plasticadhaerens]QDV34870.1 hypothetical protein ElP_27670 [Tautonia plasticadhaerens]